MKICRQCKHFYQFSSGCLEGSAYCKAGVRDMIYGGLQHCKDARAENGPCGPEGKLWEQYIPPPKPIWHWSNIFR